FSVYRRLASPRGRRALPTRRSSDLTATGAALAYKYGNGFPGLKVHFPSPARPAPAEDAPSLQGRLAVAFFGDGALNEGAWHESRSEEHTSELQSREKLVCRPQLE